MAAVVPSINELMAAEPRAHGPQGIVFPTWIVTPPVQARLDVWVATGMIMERAGYTSENGLAALRGYAYSHSLIVEEVSQALINRDLITADVLKD